MAVYQWAPGSYLRAPAQEVGERLEQIRGEHGGALATEAVLAAASAERESALGACFTWADDKAAHLYRLDEARRVVRSVCIMHEPEAGGPPRATLAYVHISPPGGEPHYVSTSAIADDEGLRQLALAEIDRMLRGLRQRYEHVGGLKELLGSFDRARRKAAKRPRAAARSK
jgi:hypothetical protein